jgi:tight adherence protein C
MIDSHPLVARLLSTATLQLRAGAPREVAIRAMGEQSCVDEVRSFATLLIQSDRLGTSISQTLRVYASEMREKRQMRAEEKAHRLPVVISIPLVICMLPTMIGVLMLPGMVRVVRELLPALGG